VATTTDDQRQFGRVEETFHQQDRAADAGLAQFQCFLDAGHAKAIGLVLQRAGTLHRAMAVGIGLDDRQRLAATELAGQAVVVAQGLQVDQCLCRAHQCCPLP